MTILCPAELAAAARFAEETDDRAARMALDGLVPDSKRGRAATTLLECIAARAAAEAAANAERRFSGGTMVETDSVCCGVPTMCDAELPRLEVRIAADFAQHSFFFYEDWVNPRTGMQVRVLDPVWYVFDGPAEDVSKMTDDQLEAAMLAGRCHPAFDEGTAVKAEEAGHVVRRVMRRRRGLTGGLICHEECESGRPTGLFYWSTHT